MCRWNLYQGIYIKILLNAFILNPRPQMQSWKDKIGNFHAIWECQNSTQTTFSAKINISQVQLKDTINRVVLTGTGCPLTTHFLAFTLCLIGVNLGKMEKIGVNLGRMEKIERKIEWKTMFSTVWQTRENREEGKAGRKFSLPGSQIFFSQIGRKSLKRKCSLGTFTIMPSGIK